MARNRAARVRQEALIGWIGAFPAESHPRLLQALLDRPASVRALAQYELKQRGVDTVEFYRTEVKGHQAPQPTAILGLGEVGGPDDESLVEPYLKDADARRRNAAVHAIDRIGRDKRAELLVAAIGDAAPGVSRAASRALVGNPTGVDFGSLLSAFRDEDRPYIRRNYFRVLAVASKWSRLRYSVIAASDQNPEIRSAGLQQIIQWTRGWNRSFVEPTTQDMDAIRAAIQGLDVQDRAHVLNRIGSFLGPSAR
jgi:hypothetical protein